DVRGPVCLCEVRQRRRLVVPLFGRLVVLTGERHVRGGHQSADGDFVSREQNALAQYPPRRLAWGSRSGRTGQFGIEPTARDGLRYCRLASALGHHSGADADLRFVDGWPTVPQIRSGAIEYFSPVDAGLAAIADPD